MTSDKEKVSSQQQVGRHAGARRSLLGQNLHTSGKFSVHCRILKTSLDGNISAESFISPENFFVKDCRNYTFCGRGNIMSRGK